MDPVFAKCLKPLDQARPGRIEIFENRFETLRSDGLHSYQRSFDSGLSHCVQELRVLSGLHRDLGKEDRVSGEVRQTLHQLKAFTTNRLQLAQFLRVTLTFRQLQVGQRHWIEV